MQVTRVTSNTPLLRKIASIICACVQFWGGLLRRPLIRLDDDQRALLF
jgi:hypothetical protein